MFKGRHFDQSVILLCVRWYLAYGLSLRDLKEMMAERGISIDHSTINRWVIHFSPLLLKRFNRRKRAVGGKWHMDAQGFGPPWPAGSHSHRRQPDQPGGNHLLRR